MAVPASTRVRVALAKSMEKGLSVEEIVRLDPDEVVGSVVEEGAAEEMIQLKMACAAEGELA